MLSGLVGNVDIPKQTGSSTAYWVGEDGSATDSEVAFGTVQLSPRTIANAVPITRRMLMQTDMSVDALITADIANVMALAIDLAILEGNGVNKPLGIVSTTGVNTQSVASAGAPTWAELVGFESSVDTDNALVGNLAYVTTPAVKGTLKTTKKDSGSGIFLLDGGVANGYRVATTTQLTTNRIIFGNFADVIIANWGVLDIMQDLSTKAASGGVVIRAFQDLDAAVRHAESFCINT
jgi:HK97 family phage major capsid protein